MKTDWYRTDGLEKLSPGLYVTKDGQVHLMIPELLDHFGYADTPENREVATAAALEAWRRAYPNTPVHEVD